MFDFNPVQGWMDALSRQWQEERSAEGLTLGRIIDLLAAMPPETRIRGLGDLESYRGYYSDLAFDPHCPERRASDILDECRRAMGRVFQGYKGGDFLMGENTPLWVSPWGESSGLRLMGFETDSDDVLRPVTVNEHDEDES